MPYITAMEHLSEAICCVTTGVRIFRRIKFLARVKNDLQLNKYPDTCQAF